MVKRLHERVRAVKEDLYGEKGHIDIHRILNDEMELCGKGTAFSHSFLDVGGAIGFHMHENDFETYYILNGTAEFNDNGTLYPIGKGDVAFTAAGEGHAIRNTGDGPLEFIALILYK